MIDVTAFEKHQDDFHELIRLFATAFYAWKEKTSRRREQTLEQGFPIWWILKGPTNIVSEPDTQVVKSLILAECRRMAQVPSTAELPRDD